MSVHLYTLSHYSLLQGMMSIEQLVTTAKKRGFSAIALTDLNTMYGIPEFIKQCKKHDLKPLIGSVVDFEYQQQLIPVVMIAKNQTGYKQLIYISTLANQSKKPVDLALATNIDQLITIVLSEGGWLEGELILNDQASLSDKLEVIRRTFADVYIGLSTNESPFWNQLNRWAKGLVTSKGLRT
ncbi:MAG: PHP domain-containing protein, partial [Erysipelotrichaceae bacterium]|nr:PHP domain-containing protein [Erysipelotrichaceae bacterium]